MTENEQKVLDQWNEQERIIADVRSRYSDVPFPSVGTEPVWFGNDTNTLERDPSRVAIVGWGGELEKATMFAVASNQYNLIPHEMAVYYAEQEMLKHPEYGTPSINIHLLQDGAKMKMEIDFPETEHIEVKKGDPVRPRVGFHNSYDLGWEFRGFMGAMVLICSNGAVAFKLNQQISKKHRMNLDPVAQTGLVGGAMTAFSDQVGIWQHWAEKQLTAAQFEPIWEALPFGKNHREEILALPHQQTNKTLNEMMREDAINAWDGYNILTQFLTHNIESEMVRTDKSEQVAKVFHQRIN